MIRQTPLQVTIINLKLEKGYLESTRLTEMGEGKLHGIKKAIELCQSLLSSEQQLLSETWDAATTTATNSQNSKMDNHVYTKSEYLSQFKPGK